MKKYTIPKLVFILFLSIQFLMPGFTAEQSSKEYFSIKKNLSPPHKAFGRFSKLVDVFGVKIYAMSDVRDRRLLHAANILAQYIDNDEDGTADNPKILKSMISNNASVFMATEESRKKLRGIHRKMPKDFMGQGLWDEETIPGGASKGLFDASLEELLHIVTNSGWAYAYPEIFAEKAGTAISQAMDIARGGRFLKIPTKYPESAWYSYDDETCEYDCQVAEYTYWALTSILGGQDFPGRLEHIEHEWKLNTREKVRSGDKAVYMILTDPEYKLPVVLPDGTYRQ